MDMPNTITWCMIEDDRCLGLLDTCFIVNVISTDYSASLDLQIGPLDDMACIEYKFLIVTLQEP